MHNLRFRPLAIFSLTVYQLKKAQRIARVTGQRRVSCSLRHLMPSVYFVLLTLKLLRPCLVRWSHCRWMNCMVGVGVVF